MNAPVDIITSQMFVLDQYVHVQYAREQPNMVAVADHACSKVWDVVNIATGQHICQLKSHEVASWLCRYAMGQR